jgi:serine/threonine protein kinase
MAVAQVLGADFLFFDWKENVLSGLGSGATGKIHQSPLFLNKGFAFKTFHISKSLELEAATYRTLVAEMLTLCHADIEKHPNIVKLYGVTFDVVSFQQGPEFHRRVWPVLVLEKSSHGDLRQFFQHQEMSFEQAILVTMQIGSAIKEMHLAGKFYHQESFGSFMI